jgi:hypothetical protein
MQGSLQKSLDHAQSLTYLGSRYSERYDCPDFLSFLLNYLFGPSLAALFSLPTSHKCLADPFLCCSIIGSSWTTAVKELVEHYSQREAVYPVLKQVIYENLKRIRSEKVDEHNKVDAKPSHFSAGSVSLVG